MSLEKLVRVWKPLHNKADNMSASCGTITSTSVYFFKIKIN